MCLQGAQAKGARDLKREGRRWLHVLAGASALLAVQAPAVTAQESGVQRERSPGIARALSLVGTAAPVALSLSDNDAASYALLGGGLILGPSIGYVYAGDAKRGMKRAGVRAAVLAATLGPALLLGDPDPQGDVSALRAALALGGGIATVVLAVLDIKRVGDRVRAQNEVLRPAYFRNARTVGFVLTLRH